MASLGSGINVRLDTDTKRRLDIVAELSGIKASNLIRQAVTQFLDEIERDGQISISIDISQSSDTQKSRDTNSPVKPQGVVIDKRKAAG